MILFKVLEFEFTDTSLVPSIDFTSSLYFTVKGEFYMLIMSGSLIYLKGYDGLA
jgi:hypothetical protein